MLKRRICKLKNKKTLPFCFSPVFTFLMLLYFFFCTSSYRFRYIPLYEFYELGYESEKMVVEGFDFLRITGFVAYKCVLGTYCQKNYL